MNPQRPSMLKNRSLPFFQIALLVLLLVLCAIGIVSSTAQAPQGEREIEDKIPKHLPIKVKVNNLNSERWTRDLEIEVKNTGEKPIYALHFALVSHEVQSEDGHDIAVIMVHYGRSELIDFDAPLEPTDVPIQPGETHTFKISEGEANGWENILKQRKLPKGEPRKLRLVINLINFGDGTGFWTTGGVPVDMHKKRAANGSCIEGTGTTQAVRLKDSSDVSIGIRRQTYSPNLPAAFLPVNFSLAAISKSNLSVSASFRRDTCCPGQQGCSRRKPVKYTCCLGDADTTQEASCDDPRGVCGTDYMILRPEICDEFGTRCPEFFTDPCPPANSTPPPTPTDTPTPTPTPSPTDTPPPSCDPAAKPNDSCVCDEVKRPDVMLSENGLT